MSDALSNLFPQPRAVTRCQGVFALGQTGTLGFDGPPADLLPARDRVRRSE